MQRHSEAEECRSQESILPTAAHEEREGLSTGEAQDEEWGYYYSKIFSWIEILAFFLAWKSSMMSFNNYF